LEARIKEFAFELGFDAFGITNTDPIQNVDVLESKIQSRSFTGMDWMRKTFEVRINPRKLMPAANSIIILAASYYIDDKFSEQSLCENKLSFARYALFTDYHKVLKERLTKLEDFIRKISPEQVWTKSFVDTSPVMERAIAHRAGIGFYGKNSNIIIPNSGNWNFLCGVLTSLALKSENKPLPSYCGKCTRCIDICPTGALSGPYNLDLQKCIAFLTIENKGPIPEIYRSKIGNRLFGCDACLAVCPWNRFSRAGAIMSEHVRKDILKLKPEEIASMNESQFDCVFGSTPISRCGLAGLLRNLCVVLGNSKNADNIPILKKLAQNNNQLIATHAEWALAQF